MTDQKENMTAPLAQSHNSANEPNKREIKSGKCCYYKNNRENIYIYVGLSFDGRIHQIKDANATHYDCQVEDLTPIKGRC